MHPAIRGLCMFALLVAAGSPARAHAQVPRRWDALRLSASNVSGEPLTASDVNTERALVDRAYTIRAPGLSAQAREGLSEELAEAYRGLLGRHAPAPPSVFERSFLFEHDEAGFDAIRVRPSEAAMQQHQRGVVFLHGFGGNTTLMCELVAHAAARTGSVTICPTVDGDGAWASARGRRIIELSIAHLRELGLRHIILAGLSNGANGALAHSRALRDQLAGLVLMSGGLRGRTRLPVFVVHGRRDRMARPARAVGFAERSPDAELVMLPGNHFAVLHHRRLAFARLGDWIANLPRSPGR